MADVGKDDLRAKLLAARRAIATDVHRADSERLCRHLAEAVDGARVVAAYVPVGAEPGTPEILDVLNRLCQTVLLPVTRTGPDGEHLALRWGRYRPGRLVSGRFGLQEPTEPSLPPTALPDAQVVLVPALAVARHGTRLGRGGGFYDRSLPLCAAGTRLVAVVRACEVIDELPSEPHDVRMTHALTPDGLIALGP
ncbi:MAG: 5-formyltetrahydrofolate cyclo-ligase [Mycobacterium sp.]|nr:5-formyltetrahydrofolate cyclo-ligase [Mycobacterium sp.]